MSNDDIEQQVRLTLDRRAAELGKPNGQLTDVWQQVDRRRNRRRSVAVVGSLAVIAVGTLGIAALGRDPTTLPLAGSSGSDVPDQQAAWRCTDQLNHFDDSIDGAAYFAVCEPVSIDGTAPILDPPTPTAPSGTLVDVSPTTASVGTSPPTTQFDPDTDDPVVADVPNCTPGNTGETECALVGSEQAITVGPGETLDEIARRFRLSVRTVVVYNEVNNGWTDGTAHVVTAGDVVLIPPASTAASPHSTTTTSPNGGDAGHPAAGEQEHLVREGDSLSSIAQRFGISLDQLVNYNEFEDGVNQVIRPGDVIAIPPGLPVVTGTQPARPTTTTGVP